MNLYVLVAEGVSIAGVIGVFSTQKQAESEAAAIWPETDGYHDLVIIPMALNEANPDAFTRGLGRNPRTTSTARIRVA